jgi:hypothetical protein
MELCSSFRILFEPFSVGFSSPCFSLWTTLMTGWVLWHRYVTDLIVSSDATDQGAWCNFHRFFSRYKWSLDEVCRVIAKLVIDTLVPRGAVITLAVDDTLCRKRGLVLFGAGMHHDALLSSRGLKLFSWGRDWVVVCIVVSGLPWAPPIAFALPVGFRLYVNKQGLTKGKKKRRPKQAARKRQVTPAPAGVKTRLELAVELLTQVAAWFPERMFVVTGDSLYGGRSVVQHLPENMDLVSRATIKAALYEPAARHTGVGRPRKKGARLPSIDEWADDPRKPWTTLEIDQPELVAAVPSANVRVALEHRSYVRKPEAAPGLLRRGQLERTGGQADRSDGRSDLQPDGRLVPPDRTPTRSVPTSPLVPAEEMAVVRRYADDPATSELRGKTDTPQKQRGIAKTRHQPTSSASPADSEVTHSNLGFTTFIEL